MNLVKLNTKSNFIKFKYKILLNFKVDKF